MKLSKLFLALGALSLFISCSPSMPKLEQKAEYMGHSVMIPQKWQYKTSEVAGGSAHQILCQAKDGKELFLFQWLDVTLTAEEYMAIARKAMLNEPVFSDAKYSDNVKGTVQSHPSISFDFTGKTADFKYVGKLIVFEANGKTYHIQYYSKKGSNGDKVNEEILKTMKLDESSPKQ